MSEIGYILKKGPFILHVHTIKKEWFVIILNSMIMNFYTCMIDIGASQITVVASVNIKCLLQLR